MFERARRDLRLANPSDNAPGTTSARAHGAPNGQGSTDRDQDSEQLRHGADGSRQGFPNVGLFLMIAGIRCYDELGRGASIRGGRPALLAVDLFEQGAGAHAEPLGEFRDRSHSRLAVTVLDLGDVIQVQIGRFGELFLRPAALLAEAANVGGEDVALEHATTITQL